MNLNKRNIGFALLVPLTVCFIVGVIRLLITDPIQGIIFISVIAFVAGIVLLILESFK